MNVWNTAVFGITHEQYHSLLKRWKTYFLLLKFFPEI